MSDTPDDPSAISLSDKIAITVACVGGAMAVLIYLVPTKTLLSAGIMLGLLLMFCCYPLIHFVRPWKIKIPGILIVCFLVFLFGKKVWPENKPMSDLTTEDTELKAPIVGEAPALSFYIRNSTPYNLAVSNYNLINTDTRGLRSKEDEYQREEDQWDKL